MCRRAAGILLTIFLLLSGCGSPNGTPPVAVQTPASTTQPSAPAPRAPSATPAAVLTRVQGEVSVQQVITGQVALASFGDYLWRGDVIVTEQDAQAEAVCSDGVSIRVEPSQRLTVACGETPDPVYQSVILRVHGGQIEALPSTRFGPPDYGNLPVVLSPRNTKVTDGRPTIHWLAVDGAEDYEVAVRKLDSKLWQATTRQTEMPYPKAQPALKEGIYYTVEVTAQMGPSGKPGTLETAWVTVLSAADVEQVHQFEVRVETLGLSAESARFLLAAYYADQELYDAAIAELASLAERTPSPPVYRLLGDAYLAVGLDREAAQSYAEAEVGLGHVAYAAKDFEDALSHYQAAKTLYQELGLESNAEAVEEFVADTKTRLPTPTP